LVFAISDSFFQQDEVSTKSGQLQPVASQPAVKHPIDVPVAALVLVSGGLLAGLSIGREGPTVQVEAGVMLHARRWLSTCSGIDAHDLMVAGGLEWVGTANSNKRGPDTRAVACA